MRTAVRLLCSRCAEPDDTLQSDTDRHQLTVTSLPPGLVTARADGCHSCAGYYSCLSFSMAQLLIEVPYLLGLTVMFTPIVYAMIGLEWTAAKFFWCVLLSCTCCDNGLAW